MYIYEKPEKPTGSTPTSSSAYLFTLFTKVSPYVRLQPFSFRSPGPRSHSSAPHPPPATMARSFIFVAKAVHHVLRSPTHRVESHAYTYTLLRTRHLLANFCAKKRKEKKKKKLLAGFEHSSSTLVVTHVVNPLGNSESDDSSNGTCAVGVCVTDLCPRIVSELRCTESVGHGCSMI